jgi:hypothetical protein
MSMLTLTPRASRLYGLSELSEQAAFVSGRLPAVSRNLARASLKRLLPGSPFPRDLLALTGLAFQWRFYFARQDEEIVFFFRRRASPERIVLDATMELRIGPDAFEAPEGPVAPGRTSWRITLPPFLRREVDRALLDSLGLPGAKPEDVVVFELGRAERLAIDRPGRGPGAAAMVYSEADRLDRLAPVNGRYRLRPFLSLIREIRNWLRSGLGVTAPIAPPPGEVRSDPWRLLAHLVFTCEQAARALTDAQPALLQPTVLDRITTTYGITGFTAAVILRLTAGGRLAQKDEDDPFQLRLGLDIRREAAGAVASIDLRPPDFLIDGEVHDAFLRALAGGAADFAAGLGVPPDEARAFLRRARPDAVVFRVKRDLDRDTDVVVLDGTLAGRHALVILQADFAVFAAEVPPRVERRDDLEVLFAGDFPHQDQHVLPERVVRHFLRLAAECLSWQRTLV